MNVVKPFGKTRAPLQYVSPPDERRAAQTLVFERGFDQNSESHLPLCRFEKRRVQHLLEIFAPQSLRSIANHSIACHPFAGPAQQCHVIAIFIQDPFCAQKQVLKHQYCLLVAQPTRRGCPKPTTSTPTPPSPQRRRQKDATISIYTGYSVVQ